MEKFNFKPSIKKFIGDTLTPVSIYLKLRDHFPGSILLECSDYESRQNCYSYICFDPIAEFKLTHSELKKQFPWQKSQGTKNYSTRCDWGAK